MPLITTTHHPLNCSPASPHSRSACDPVTALSGGSAVMQTGLDAPTSDPLALDSDDVIAATGHPRLAARPGQRRQLVDIPNHRSVAQDNNTPPAARAGVGFVRLEGHHAA